MVRSESTRSSGPLIFMLIAALAVGAIGGWQFGIRSGQPNEEVISNGTYSSNVPANQELAVDALKEDSELPSQLTIPKAQQERVGITTSPAEAQEFNKSVHLSGKVTLNEDNIAHIYPMVEGAVEEVHVGLGQSVKSNDLLVVVHSREVGSAKLELYQARLSLEMATVKNKIQEEISKNAEELVVALRDGQSIQDIEARFRNRGMGDYRERLLLAYANYLKSHSDVERLEAITDTGAISAKQLIAAQTSRNADLATFQARIEQIEFELKTSQLLSSQSVLEASTRVSVAETNLRILGCSEEDIASIDPEKQKENISDYPIRAPFDGVVIAKDAALKEQVHLDKQILSIADLSKVWITVDVYEQNLPLVANLAHQTLMVRNEAWPDKSFPAKVFYTGDIMDDRTRTISMRAIADNDEQLLKPGMFVKIEIPQHSVEKLLQIPKTAILEHQGTSFVFIQTGVDTFEKRDVKIGESTSETAIISEGLKAGDQVVTNGGFVLKSQLLASLMGEE